MSDRKATSLGMPLANNDTDDDEEAHKERMAKLEHNTNKLMADYQDFLSDMNNSPIEDLISGNDNNRLADDDNGDVESSDEDRSNDKGLATISEDSSSHSTLPTSNLQYYDYPDDNIDYTYDTNYNNWKRKRYTRYTFYQTIRETWGCLSISISILIIGLLCIIISLIWNSQQNSMQQQEVQHIDVYKSIQEIWDPIWYNRTTGYDGRTYEQAQNFCNDRNRILCPYSAYCPAGKNNLPSSDIKEEDESQHESWAPIYNINNNPNNNNEWVQIGKQNTCNLYSEIRGQHWEQQQDDDKYDAYLESITRHVACCIERLIKKEEHPNDGFPGYIIDRPPVLEEDVPVTAEVEKVDVQVSNMNPTWFHRAEDDWTGTTWPEAIEYCAKNQHLAVCPYNAICPHGVNKAPIEGVTYDEPKGSFAPISNGFNKWVSVSSDNTCMEIEPSWGVDKGREDLTRHIVCCEVEDGGSYQGNT